MLVAMSDMPLVFMRRSFQYRFVDDDGPLARPLWGNLTIAAGFQRWQDSTYNAMQLLNFKSFHTTGKIYPSSDSPWPFMPLSHGKRSGRRKPHCQLQPAWLIMSMWTNTLIKSAQKPVKSGGSYSWKWYDRLGSMVPSLPSILPNLMINEIGEPYPETKAQVSHVW